MANPVAAVEHQIRPFARLPGSAWAMLAEEDDSDFIDIALEDRAPVRLLDGSEAPLANTYTKER